MKHWIHFILTILLALCLSPEDAQAQNESQATETGSAPAKESPSPLTTADPAIDVVHLDLLVDPLTLGELQIEADAWRDLVKAKATTIAEQDISMRAKSEEIAEVDAQSGGEGQKKEEKEQKKDEKVEFLGELTKLRDEKAALLERLDIVLDDWESKGGDPTEYRQYASAVSGIKVELTDASATWTAVTGWLTSKEGGN